MAPAVGGTERLLTAGPSPARERDRTPADAVAAGHLREEDPPPVHDLRADWWEVGEQGETGSCVGWAVADSVLRRQLVAAGRLGEHEALSPRFVWMAAKEMRAKLSRASAAAGAWRPSTFLERGLTDVKSGLDVTRFFGAALEHDLRWHGRLHEGDVDAFYAGAAERRIAAYYRLDTDDDPARWFATWRRWIAQHGPVLIVVGVDRCFGAGAARLDAFDLPAGEDPDLHAAALVGYEPGAFRIRCSWGEDWADGGHALAAEAWLEQGTYESYGVVI